MLDVIRYAVVMQYYSPVTQYFICTRQIYLAHVSVYVFHKRRSMPILSTAATGIAPDRLKTQKPSAYFWLIVTKAKQKGK